MEHPETATLWELVVGRANDTPHLLVLADEHDTGFANTLPRSILDRMDPA